MKEMGYLSRNENTSVPRERLYKTDSKNRMRNVCTAYGGEMKKCVRELKKKKKRTLNILSKNFLSEKRVGRRPRKHKIERDRLVPARV